MVMQMADIDLTQTVSKDTVNYLGMCGMLILSVIFILVFIFLKRYKARFIPLLMGILGYVVFAYFGYKILLSIFISLPGIEEGFSYNEIMLKSISLVIFIVMFTLARIALGKILFQNYDRPGDILNFGLGIGLCDAVMYAFSTLTLMIWSIGINSSGLAELFKDFSETEMINNYDSISMIFTAPSILWVFLAISAVMDIVLNCGLAVIIYGVISKKIPAWWYAASAIINYLVILPFNVYDSSSTTGVIMQFAIKIVVFVITMIVIYRIDANYIGGIISFKEKGLNKIVKMPKFGKLNNK